MLISTIYVQLCRAHLRATPINNKVRSKDLDVFHVCKISSPLSDSNPLIHSIKFIGFKKTSFLEFQPIGTNTLFYITQCELRSQRPSSSSNKYGDYKDALPLSYVVSTLLSKLKNPKF